MTVEAFYGRGGYLGATGKPFSGQKRCLAAETSLRVVETAIRASPKAFTEGFSLPQRAPQSHPHHAAHSPRVQRQRNPHAAHALSRGLPSGSDEALEELWGLEVSPEEVFRLAQTPRQRQALLSTRAAHQTEKASREAVSSDSSHAVALQVEPGKCSGCGSTFQRDTPEAPGYVLPHLELLLQQQGESSRGPLSARLAAGGTGKKMEQPCKRRMPLKRPFHPWQVPMHHAHCLPVAICLVAPVLCMRCHGLRFGNGPGSASPQLGAGAEVARASEAAALTAALRTKRTPCWRVSPVPSDASAAKDEGLVPLQSEDVFTFGAFVRLPLLPPAAPVRRQLLPTRILTAVSSKSGEGIESLFKEVFAEAARRNRSVYLLGAANSGKSSICNFLLRRWGAKGRAKADPRGGVSVSALPGTTLSFVSFTVDGRFKLFDAPGIIPEGAFSPLLSHPQQKLLLGAGGLYCSSVRLEGGEGLWLGPFGFCRNDGSQALFVTLMLNKNLTVKIPGRGWREGACDLVIGDIGWLSLTGSGRLAVSLYIPKGDFPLPPLLDPLSPACLLCAVSACLLLALLLLRVLHSLSLLRKPPAHPPTPSRCACVFYCHVSPQVACKTRPAVLPDPLLLCPSQPASYWNRLYLSRTSITRSKRAKDGGAKVLGKNGRPLLPPKGQVRACKNEPQPGKRRVAQPL
ncbi:nitric-oxide synthase [Cyclospora cayetanensis]|uniref:Nitric-oxide synthase n=1 Tax=Cyclospora cayetanensis TaxID=88456 RepID=A0A1D3D159_9EIME|nr:nitric-oxide synthase [Cyclospora cayetanensis]